MLKFEKEKQFEEIWIAEQKDIEPNKNTLNDTDYLDYYIWKDINEKAMYKKHFPTARVYKGVNPNIIFHGGCLGCLSQRKHGIDRCKGCMYFRSRSFSKPDLKIEGEECASISAEEFQRLLGLQ